MLKQSRWGSISKVILTGTLILPLVGSSCKPALSPVGAQAGFLAGNGGEVALLSSGNHQLLVHAPDGSLVRALPGGRIVDAIFLPDGTHVVARDDSSRVRFLSLGDDLGSVSFEGSSDTILAAVHILKEGTSTVLTFSADGKIQIYDAGRGKLQSQGSLSQGPDFLPRFDAAAFSPDGKLLVASGGIQIFAWNTDTGRFLGDFRAHDDRITSLHFSSGGDLVLSTSLDARAKVWAVSNPPFATITVLSPSSSAAMRFGVFSSDGKQALLISDDHQGRLYDVSTGRLVSTLDGKDKNLMGGGISPNGNLALTYDNIGNAQVWDLSKSSYEWKKTVDVNQLGVFSVAPTDDGKKVMVGGFDSQAWVWNVDAEAPTLLIDPASAGKTHGGSSLVSVAMTPDGSAAFTASTGDRLVKRWNPGVANQTPLRLVDPLYPMVSGSFVSLSTVCKVIDAAVARDASSVVVSCMEQERVTRWEATDPTTYSSARILDLPNPSPGGPTTVAESSDGRTVVIGGHDGGGHGLITVQTKQGTSWMGPVPFVDPALSPMGISHTSTVCSLGLSSNGNEVIAGDFDGIIKLWSLQGTNSLLSATLLDPKLVAQGISQAHTFTGPRLPIDTLPIKLSVAISADGTRIASGANDGKVKVWQQTGPIRSSWVPQELANPNLSGTSSGLGVEGAVTSVKITPDGQTVVAGSTNGTVGTVTLWQNRIALQNEWTF